MREEWASRVLTIPGFKNHLMCTNVTAKSSGFVFLRMVQKKSFVCTELTLELKMLT